MVLKWFWVVLEWFCCGFGGLWGGSAVVFRILLNVRTFPWLPALQKRMRGLKEARMGARRRNARPRTGRRKAKANIHDQSFVHNGESELRFWLTETISKYAMV